MVVTAENYKKDATRELRLKHEIESKFNKLWHKIILTTKNFHVTAFLEERASHFEDLTRQWTEKFENEVQLLDDQINETKDVMIALKLKYDDLVEQFNMREFEIQDYVEEKRVKDKSVMEAEQQYQAIVKIQSWWKGIMVRKGRFFFKFQLFQTLHFLLFQDWDPTAVKKQRSRRRNPRQRRNKSAESYRLSSCLVVNK